MFSNFQFGFRKKFSTNPTTTYLYETILQQFDRNHLINETFLDFAKAFDCVNHRILLDKLNHCWVSGCAFSRLQSYLNNRYQYIFYTNQIFSDHLPITTGVPQGSVVGPFLFCVYINDLPNSCNGKMMLYADDSVMVCDDSDLLFGAMFWMKITHWRRKKNHTPEKKEKKWLSKKKWKKIW